MKRRVFCLGGMSSLLAVGCGPGPGPECLEAFTSPILVKVTNHGATSIRALAPWFDHLQNGETHADSIPILSTATCGGPPLAPKPSELSTAQVWLFKNSSTPDQGKLLFGGPLVTYEEWKASNPTSDFAKATLYTHSLFFVPGSQVRQDMGLVVNNPTGTEIFTSLDPWRPYKFEGFTLNVDVYDLDAGDIRMSVTGTLAN